MFEEVFYGLHSINSINQKLTKKKIVEKLGWLLNGLIVNSGLSFKLQLHIICENTYKITGREDDCVLKKIIELKSFI